MSLPYPSMVFVPLDILTAEEMNQIVGNIESLAAGTGLNDGAVTSDKIDSTTFAAQSLNFSITNSKVTSSNVKLTFNSSNVGVISGSFKVVGDIAYGEELLRLNNKATITAGTVIGQLFNTDFATPTGANYIKVASNSTKTGLNGWNNINCAVVLS